MKISSKESDISKNLDISYSYNNMVIFNKTEPKIYVNIEGFSH